MVWGQAAAPAVRGLVDDVDDVAPVLDDLAARLATGGDVLPPDLDGDRPAVPARSDEDHGGHGSHGAEGSHAAEEGHGGHEDHGGGMDVDGLPMADRAEDRDGLTLDVLHLSLGPVLPAWPAGLVLDVALQGDVLQSAEARVLPGLPWPHDGSATDPGGRLAAAHLLDAAAGQLLLAGWADARGVCRAPARRLRRCRPRRARPHGGRPPRGRPPRPRPPRARPPGARLPRA